MSDIAVPPQPPAPPLQQSDFALYDTVADGVLELKELKSNGKLDEFSSRFYATPEGAAAYFVRRLSRTLTEYYKDDIAARLESGDGLDEATRQRLEYWAAHDFKKRAVTLSGRTSASYERVGETMEFGGSATGETTSVPSLGVGGNVATETKLGSWKWYNTLDAESGASYGTYRATQDGETAVERTQTGAYGAFSAASEAKLGEQASVNASASYEGLTNPLPEAQTRSWSAAAGGAYSWSAPRGGVWEAEGSGSYYDTLYAPAALAGQGQSSYRHANAAGGLAYQKGRHGVILTADYFDMRSADDFQTLDMGLAEGKLTYRTDLWRGANLSVGGEGARATYASDLTGIATEEGKAYASASLITPLFGPFSSETHLTGGAVYSAGSLNGWYGDVDAFRQTLRYTAGTLSVGATAGANGYARELKLADDSGAERQTEFAYSLGGTAAWAPRDWVSATGTAAWNVADQEGYQAVDTGRLSTSLVTSVRFTGESARRAGWLDLTVSHAEAESVFGSDFYDHAETNAVLTLTVK